ncbi:MULTISPECIES: hypothetical protein [unclassified Duganella]|uniref:hypothetical protein n=1 Tax=unclassified Duganella TaxID=2636909 RepID=UPI000886F67E|nr:MULTISPECIES: hypothetical protein [unclassified Duganella]SDH42020.1 hypothetical protein SAMN05216320_11333 [Duganella sp. OV458]SDK60354.1 hypothetical protein SAMN05428973_113129 [Duganella sp. OV510]
MSNTVHHRDDADKHDLRIHRAKQLCRQVLHDGVKKFIAGFCWHDGDDEMVVYLKGSAKPVRPCEITIPEHSND